MREFVADSYDYIRGRMEAIKSERGKVNSGCEACGDTGWVMSETLDDYYHPCWICCNPERKPRPTGG